MTTNIKDTLLQLTGIILGIIIGLLIGVFLLSSSFYYFATDGIYGSIPCTTYPEGDFIGIIDNDFNNSFEIASRVCNNSCEFSGVIHEGDCNAVYCECVDK